MRRALLLFFVFICITVSVVVPHSVNAMVTGCSVNVSPTTTTRETSTIYSFDGSVDTSEPGEGIMWVRFTRPSADFTITNGTASGWSDSTDGTTITFTAPSQTFFSTFEVYATSGSSDASAADWSVQVSSDGSGAPAATCGGDLGVSISGSSSITPTPTATPTPIPDTTAPTISNVTVSSVSDSSVTISWETNESANTLINYGTTTSYGSSKNDSAMVTSHSVTLSSLSSNTTYHGQLKSTDSAGNTATSSDFTFATSQTTTVTVTTTTTVNTTTTTLVTPTPTPTPTPDLTPPKITLKTDLSNVFSSAPKVEGEATDNVAVAQVEYSVDDGQHWANVELSSTSEKKISFVFTPLTQGDGNYSVKVRAIDTNNNDEETDVQVMIIDRLPPAIGGALFSIGPQILQPSPNGSLLTLAGMTPKLTFAAVGGPTSVNLKINNQSIPLSQNPQTRLWSGNFLIGESGTYTIETESVDGAKNRTTKSLSYLTVVPNGIVSDILGPVSNARLKVFYFDTQAQEFRLWGASQYGQQNPQMTDELGRYKLLLPAGTYYIQIEAAHSRPLRTNIFTLTQSTPIAQNFTLTKKAAFQFGSMYLPLPDFGQNDAMMELPEKDTTEISSNALVGKAFPDFQLSGVNNTTLTGKPTVITVLTTWLPQSAAQMSIIDEVSKESGIGTLVIMSQESVASVNVFAKLGGYSVPVVADPDGVLVTPLQVRTLPTHYFVDRSGVVTKVVSGILGKAQIESLIQ